MVKKDEFPLTLGGHALQKEYRGFDLVVLCRHLGGIEAFVIDPKTKCSLWSVRYSYEDKGEMFKKAEEAVDVHLMNIEKWLHASPKHDVPFYKSEARISAMKAFEVAMALSDVDLNEINRIRDNFSSELEDELNKNFKNR